MDTPWGDLEVSDAHVHFFSRPFFRALGGGEPDTLTKTGWEIPGDRATELAGRWVGELDRRGVKKCVLIASVPGDEGSVGEAVRDYPERLIGYFMLDPTAADAGQRLRRSVERLGLRGICLFPAMQKFSVQDARLKVVYDIAASHPGVVVFLHMGVLSVGARKKMGLPSLFDISFSNPLDLHRVALENPKANFVIPHFGAGYLRETLMIGDLCPNVYVDTSSSNSWMRYIPGLSGLPEVFKRTLDVFGPKRILFGTDSSYFPRGWNDVIFKTQVEALREIGCDAETAEAIFGGNLDRLLALEKTST